MEIAIHPVRIVAIEDQSKTEGLFFNKLIH